MPVFNAAAFLVEAVESVLAQTLGDIELVAVNDGSEDASAAILERFARSDPRVRVVTNPANLGVRAAANQAWQAARAPYVARLDADDVALPDRLRRQVGFLDDHPSVAVVGGAMILIDAAGRPGPTVSFATKDTGIRATLGRRNCLANPTVLMRRSALESVGGYRLNHAQDYDLWLRLSERFELANLDEPVTLYRQHPGQLSARGIEHQTRGRIVALASASARRSGLPDPLEGVGELTPELLTRLGVREDQVAREFERDRVDRAATLASLGYRTEAVTILGWSAAAAAPRRSVRAFEAALELKRADRSLASARPLDAAVALIAALRQAPLYASGRLLGRARDRVHGRRLLPGSVAALDAAAPQAVAHRRRWLPQPRTPSARPSE
jgi:hypothetical protein